MRSQKRIPKELQVGYVRQITATKPYDRFTDENCYMIASYCAQHGPVATVKHFKLKLPNL